MYKIVIVLRSFLEYRKPFFDLLSSRLKEDNIELTVLSSDHAKSINPISSPYFKPINALPIHLGPAKFSYKFLNITSLKNYDLVVLEHVTKNLEAYLIISYLHKVKIPFALWGMGGVIHRKVGKVEKKILDWLKSKSSFYFAYTDHVKTQLVSQGYDQNKIAPLNNSTDGLTLQKCISSIDNIEVDQFKEKYGLTDKTCLYIGRLDPDKEIRNLIITAEKLQQKIPDFRLILLGNGSEEGYVKSQVKKYNWLVHMEGSFSKTKYLALKASKFLCSPGLVGLLAVDSFYARKPMLFRKLPYNSTEISYLTHGYNSYETGYDWDLYREGMEKLLLDSALLEKLVVGCVESSKKISLEKMVLNFQEGVLKVLETKKIEKGT